MIFHSSYPDIVVPDVSLATFVLEQAEQLSEKPALIDGPSGRTLTYGQLALAARHAATGLSRRGFAKGDVFATYSPNIPEYAIALLAVARLGGINTTINPLYTVEELTYQLNDTGATFLLTIPQFVEKAREAAARSAVREVFVFGEAEGATPVVELLANDGQAPEVAIDPRRDIVAIPYSSGTTGLPKGVLLTHANLIANMLQSLAMIESSDNDVILGVLPFYHIYGMTIILYNTLHRGGTLVTMPRFEFEPFLKILQDYGVTTAGLVPPIIVGLAKHPAVASYDLSKLRYLGSGAAPLGADVQAACSARVGCPIIQGYGMTETSAATHITPLGRAKTGSVGVLVPNTECKVMDPGTGAELGPNAQGEICVRGPQVTRGYLHRPEETAALIDSDGWLHTGDIGYADDEGYFFVVDRVKELIKYNGLQVAPAELEAVLLTHPAVADAAVIPVPDAEAGEIPKALVVLRAPATDDEIMAYVAARVAPHKKVRRVEVVEEIPKALSGKILRRVLVERERARAGVPSAAPPVAEP